MRNFWSRFGMAVLVLALLAGGLVFLTGSASAAGGYAGYVYTETNAAAGNGIAVLGRGADGSLSVVTNIPTGGLGSGAGLGSEGALALSDNGKWLLAVNAGSNDISAISLRDGAVASRASSGGSLPISVTAHGHLVYVLNAGASGNISGFWLDNQGNLSPVAGSTRPLSGAGAGPAQIQFDQTGEVLVVTEKTTGLIDTYTVGEDGQTQGPITHSSSGAVPFGFDFGGHNTLIVSEAAASAASSYRVTEDGGVNLVTGSLVDGQAAACWLVVTGSGRYAFAANAHSGNISSYAVASDGSLTLLNGVAATTGGAPLDEAISRNDKFLYVLNPAAGMIDAFGLNAGGGLSALAGVSGIPASAAGLVAR